MEKWVFSFQGQQVKNSYVFGLYIELFYGELFILWVKKLQEFINKEILEKVIAQYIMKAIWSETYKGGTTS